MEPVTPAALDAAARSLPTPAGEVWSYRRCRLLRCIDGDTIEVAVDTGWGNVRPKEIVRLWGINAPEKNTPEGVSARLRLLTLLDGAGDLRLDTIKDAREKYGRMMSLVYRPGEDVSVNQVMVDEGHAKAYDGKGPR